MDEILKEILSRDKSILARRDDLIKILDEEVPNNQRRTYAAIRKALTLNVGEIFLVSDFSDWEKQERARQILKESGMQDAKIDEVINIFANVFKLNAQLKYTLEDRIKSIEENLKLCFIDEKILLRVKNLENKITENETLKKRIADLEENLNKCLAINQKLFERVENFENQIAEIDNLEEKIAKLDTEIERVRLEILYPKTKNSASSAQKITKSFINDYNIWQKKSLPEKTKTLKNFIKKYKVRGFSCINYNERMNHPELPPIFEENFSASEGDYLASKSENDIFAVVPKVVFYDKYYHVGGAMCEVFESNYNGGDYVNIQLERAAEFTNSGKNWTLIRKGKLILR